MAMKAHTNRPHYYSGTKTNVIRIFRILKKASKDGEGHISISEISRRTGLHRWTVSRTLDVWMSHFVEIVVPEELEHVGLKLKLVRLNNVSISEESVMRSMKIRL